MPDHRALGIERVHRHIPMRPATDVTAFMDFHATPARSLTSRSVASLVRRLTGLGVALMLIVLSACVVSARSALSSDDRSAIQGLDLARLACAACHQVSADQPPPPPVWNQDEKTGIAAPSFMAIVGDPVKDASYLRHIIVEPHYPMKEQRFIPDDLEAIITYMLSLRPTSGTARK